MMRPMILAAAALASTLACNDSFAPTPRKPSGIADPPPDLAIELSGRVSVGGADSDFSVSLTTREGNVVRLIGSQTAWLASIDRADVILRGAWEDTETPGQDTVRGPDRMVVGDDGRGPGPTRVVARFIVYSFEVTAVEERAAIDGILELTDEGYGLRLANGDLRMVPWLPDGALSHLGERLWVVGSGEEPPVIYGLITAR